MKDIELWHGDCLDVMSAIPDTSVDMVFADLPYSHVEKGTIRRCTARAWDVPVDLDELWMHFLRLARPCCTFVFTAIQPFTTALINSQPKLFKYDLVWKKTKPSGYLSAKSAPLRYHESILVFGRKSHYDPQMGPEQRYTTTKGRKKSFRGNMGIIVENSGRKGGQAYPGSVLSFPQPDLRTDRLNGHEPKRYHPTQKPIAMLDWLIKTYTKPGATILDPVMGSGTTACASAKIDRKFIGCEKDAGYYQIAVDRVRKAMAEPRQAELAL